VGVAAAVTAPFFLWNPREFVRSVVLFHLNQPFRPDAINYQVWYYNCFGQKAPAFAPFAAVLSAIGIGLWRCVRCPAGYAAAVTLVSLAFFAFNQESSFCNHYYFVIATSCWCVATTSETERGSEGKFEPVVDAGSC
jgi:hypothetical protein